jgi:F-box interacting protein
MSDNIPLELIVNILARLPVEDVLRCASVCKSWYSLVTSPSFASLHQDLSSPNHGPCVLVEYYNREDVLNWYYGLHRDNQSFDVIAKFDPPHHPSWKITESYWDIVDSLNGIVCLCEQHFVHDKAIGDAIHDNAIDDEIVLWNPSLRKSLILPKPRVSEFVSKIDIGFGFLAESNEYMVVRISYTFDTMQNGAEIYELSTGSWRDLKHGDVSHSELHSQQAHYKGILHWFASYLEKDNSAVSYFICTFDIKDEKFGALMLPNCIRHESHEDYEHIQPSVVRELLCLIHYSAERSCTIWAMKEYGVDDSWQKIFSIDKERLGITCSPVFRHDGGILLVKLPETPTGRRDLVSYDCNNKQVKNLELSATHNVHFVRTYVDSLALIKAPNDAKTDEVRFHQDC